MFGIIKELFFVLLTSLVNASIHTKYVSLKDWKCKIQPALEYSQELNHYSFVIKSDRFVGSWNILMTYLLKYVF